LSYDTVRDFAPIARIGYAPYVLVAHPSLPVRSIKALIQLGKVRPGEVTWAYGGSASQLAAALFKSMAHVDLLLVPYKGNALAVTAVIGGETSLVFGGIAQAAPQVKSGRLRALGVTSTGRSPILPDAPPIAQTAPGFEVSTWYGLLAPAGTPRSVIERINTELVRILQMPDVRQRLAAEAFELPADTPGQFAAIIKAELAKWPQVVKDTGVRTD
jgi:tripartite-type tricarboxylate transporter receptor subunit TctC